MFNFDPALSIAKTVTAAGLLTGFLISPARPQATTPASANAPVAAGPSRYLSSRGPEQMDRYYGFVWGVESLSAKLVESGELIRFSYVVLDPAKAKTLNDKKLQPALDAPRAGVKLVIPQLEQVGMLRQSSAPEAGKTYWMAFSNKGGVVKHGDRVDVIIGPFRAAGLIVE